MAPLPLPPLQLSQDEARELRLLSDDVERETLRTYEEFMYRDRHRVDEKRWKPVRSLEELRAYKERNTYKDSHGMARALQNNVYQHLEIGPQAAMSANSKMPIMMCVGTIPGLLDDAMYGALMHDSVSLRSRAHYWNDAYDDNVMVTTIEAPTPEEPLNFLGIAWYLRRFHMPLIVSDRDILLLTAMRFGQLSNGERVGLSLYHTVEHRDFPVMKERGILRMDMTLGIVFRQLPNHRLDVYMIGFVEPHGSTPEMFGIQDAAKTLLLGVRFPDIAFLKKLHWRMREKQRKAQRNRSASTAAGDQTKCAMCTKKLGGFLKSSGATCQICSRRVCGKCSTKRKIIIESTREETTFRPFDFCLSCTLETKDIPAMAVAQDEVFERSASKQHPSQSSSTSSTRSM